jgi:hypothetical protein
MCTVADLPDTTTFDPVIVSSGFGAGGGGGGRLGRAGIATPTLAALFSPLLFFAVT